MAQIEAGLTDDQSICSVYPGPPEVPEMRNNDVVWLPCPLTHGRYFKISAYPMLTTSEVELFGY